jgi:hypothetical protein
VRAQRRHQRIDLGRGQDPRQLPDRADERDTLARAGRSGSNGTMMTALFRGAAAMSRPRGCGGVDIAKVL